MIKWAEFIDGNFLYEAFLPEHEQEACEWLLRASCRGHILAERRRSLTWPPKFGPDGGDVAALEAMTEVLFAEMSSVAVHEGTGAYVPGTVAVAQAEPFLHAVLCALVEDYSRAEVSLGLDGQQSTAYLDLPICASASGLYPFAVTPKRDDRMRRMIALDRALKARAELQAIKGELLSSVLEANIPRLRALVGAAGVDIEGDGKATA